MTRPAMRAAWLLTASALAGCGGSTPTVPQNFPALHYEYLTPLRLNVASIDVQDQSTPPDGDLSGQSPVKPEQALEKMAHDRLQAAGPSGTATFIVTEASIVPGGNGVTEHLAARLVITNASGGQAGFAEAHVSRTANSSGGDQTGPAALYELTRQAMDDMNVEFEYQVRHSLHDWLVSGAAVPAPVEQAPLGGSGPMSLTPSPTSSLTPPGSAAAPLTPPAPGGSSAPAPDGGPTQLAPPPSYAPPSAPPPVSGTPSAPGFAPSYAPDGSSQAPSMPAPPVQMSPPPGMLTLPPSYVPPSSQAYPPPPVSNPYGY